MKVILQTQKKKNKIVSNVVLNDMSMDEIRILHDCLCHTKETNGDGDLYNKKDTITLKRLKEELDKSGLIK